MRPCPSDQGWSVLPGVASPSRAAKGVASRACHALRLYRAICAEAAQILGCGSAALSTSGRSTRRPTHERPRRSARTNCRMADGGKSMHQAPPYYSGEARQAAMHRKNDPSARNPNPALAWNGTPAPDASDSQFSRTISHRPSPSPPAASPRNWASNSGTMARDGTKITRRTKCPKEGERVADGGARWTNRPGGSRRIERGPTPASRRKPGGAPRAAYLGSRASQAAATRAWSAEPAADPP